MINYFLLTPDAIGIVVVAYPALRFLVHGINHPFVVLNVADFVFEFGFDWKLVVDSVENLCSRSFPFLVFIIRFEST